MKIISTLAIAFSVTLLPSCGLVGSLVKIPTSILKTAGRTVGVSRLSDAPAEAPVSKEEQKEDKAKPSGLE